MHGSDSDNYYLVCMGRVIEYPDNTVVFFLVLALGYNLTLWCFSRFGTCIQSHIVVFFSFRYLHTISHCCVFRLFELAYNLTLSCFSCLGTCIQSHIVVFFLFRYLHTISHCSVFLVSVLAYNLTHCLDDLSINATCS